jgi:hypothetical protein
VGQGLEMDKVRSYRLTIVGQWEGIKEMANRCGPPDALEIDISTIALLFGLRSVLLLHRPYAYSSRHLWCFTNVRRAHDHPL